VDFFQSDTRKKKWASVGLTGPQLEADCNRMCSPSTKPDFIKPIHICRDGLLRSPELAPSQPSGGFHFPLADKGPQRGSDLRAKGFTLVHWASADLLAVWFGGVLVLVSHFLG